MRTRLAVLAAVLAVVSPVSADVLTVGPAGDFTDIQSAVDAATDLDIVLVSSGGYTGFDVGDVGVTIVADTGQAVVVNGPSRVAGLSAGRTVSLIGLAMTNEYVVGSGETDQLLEPTLWLAGNAGPVRVEDCSLAANQWVNFRAGPALAVEWCADVALARTDVVGGFDGELFPREPGTVSPPGLSVSSSTLVIHAGSVSGTSVRPASNGFFLIPNAGTAGIRVESGSVFLSGTSVTGGKGSSAISGCEPLFDSKPGGPGGPGIRIVGPTAAVRQLDTDVTGGPGGDPVPDNPPIFCVGAPGGPVGPAMDVQAGLDLAVPGAARGFSMQSPAREHEPISLDLVGPPGDLAGVFWGLRPATLFKPSLHGHALIDFGLPTFLIVVGALPASGELSVPLAFDELGPGWEGIALPFQVVTSGGPGQLYMGAPAMAVILDESL